MTISAVVYCDLDRSPRRALDVPGTLRTDSGEPVDLTIDDLSTSGFHMATRLLLSPGENFSIGVPGIGLHAAYVVRSTDAGYGCRFVAPITQQAASQVGKQALGVIHLDPARQWMGGRQDEDAAGTKLPRLVRFVVILALALASWTIPIAAYLVLT